MTNIFIANLDWEISTEDLANTFSTFGKVAYAHVVYDKETKKSKGYGYVEMESADAAIAAIQALNGVEVNGRKLDVKIASPKGSRPEKKPAGFKKPFQKKPFNKGGGGYGGGQRREGGYQSREGGYQPREGGYQPREGGGYNSNREGGYRPRPEGGGYNREGGYRPRTEGGSYNREGGGYNNNREGGYQRREGGYNPNREGGGYRPRTEGGDSYNREDKKPEE